MIDKNIPDKELENSKEDISEGSQPSGENKTAKYETENSTVFSKRVYNEKKPVRKGETKRILTVVVACVLCVAIGLSVFAVVKFLPEEQETASGNSSVLTNSIEVLKYDELVKNSTAKINGKEKTVSSNIKSFSINNYYESYTFSPYYVKSAGATVSSAASSDPSKPEYDVMWQINGIDSNLTLSATIAAHIKNCLNITASREMPNTYPTLEEYYAAYGIDSENATRGVVVEFNDGTEDMVILVGDRIPTGNGNYVTVSGDEKVYVVGEETVKYYDYLPIDFADKTMVGTMLKTDSNKKYYDDQDELVYYDYIKLSGELIGDKPVTFTISKSPSAEFLPYFMSSPYNRPANKEFIAEIISFASTGLKADSLLTYKATDTSIKNCQLDKPKCVIEFKAGDYKFKIIVGGVIQEDSTSLPVMIEGKQQIFYVDQSVFDFIPSDLENMFGTDVVMENIYTLNALEYTDSNGVHRFNIIHTPIKGETDAYTTKIKKGGTEYDTVSFKNLYQRVLYLSLLDFDTEAKKGDLVLKVRFVHKNYKDTVLEITECAESQYHYLVFVDGNVYGKVLKTSVNEITRYLDIYINGGIVPETTI
ncbi:MAG: DUF4340 domain-containing protein [Ruminococcaceae bacterium]|nr:DUF4340 domain-containing protein [Oscillospiraceae bacterium]